MTVPVIAFFSIKGGEGRTTLVYHISWMLADLGHRVVAADLDPQSFLTMNFLTEARHEALSSENRDSRTIFGALRPLHSGTGDILDPYIEIITDNLGLLPGDMELATFEYQLSDAWVKSLDGNERAFLVMSAIWRTLQKAAQKHDASLVLLDLGPSISAINCAALIASDFVIIPVTPALYSLQNLRFLGSQLRTWREGWSQRRQQNPDPELRLPSGQIEPLGYIVVQPPARLDQPMHTYQRWLSRIPKDYRTYVLGTQHSQALLDRDPDRIAVVRHYISLMSMAQEARKPMFHLKPADGALGSHAAAVVDAYRDFKAITEEILKRIQDRQSATIAG